MCARPTLALGSTLAAMDLKRGGVHHSVGAPWRVQKPRQPAAFSPGFVATHHRRGVRQTKTLFGLGDFLEHARLVTRGDRALTRLLPTPRGAAALPCLFTQLESHK
jgi:hypothetical protein